MGREILAFKERSYLQRNTTPTIVGTVRGSGKSCCDGSGLHKLFAQAQSKDFKPVELSVRLQADVGSQVRPFASKGVLAARPSTGPGATQRCRIRRIVTTRASNLGWNGHNIYNGVQRRG